MRMLRIDDAYQLDLGFNVDPPMEGEWRALSDGRYMLDGYILELRKQHGTHKVIDFTLSRTDGAQFTVREYCVCALMPAVDVYNVPPRFMGYAHVSHYNPAQIISSSTTKDFPYVIYGNRSGITRLAIGLENLFVDTLITRTGKGGYMYYDANRIRFQRPVMGVELHVNRLADAIFISDAPESWFDTTRAY